MLMPGFIFPRPHMDREKLGKGGNGKVSRHYVNQRLFAIKEVSGITFQSEYCVTIAEVCMCEDSYMHK